VGFTWHRKHSAGAHGNDRVAAAVVTKRTVANSTAAAAATMPASASAPSSATGTSAGSSSGAATAPGNNVGTMAGKVAPPKLALPVAAADANIALAKNGGAADTPRLEASKSAAGGDQDAIGQAKRRSLKAQNAGETIPPRIVAQPAPAIPPWAKGLDTDGVVKVDALIDERGNLRSTKALSGPRVLQHEAERAVALWIFEPALTDGKPTATHMVLTVQFQR